MRRGPPLVRMMRNLRFRPRVARVFRWVLRPAYVATLFVAVAVGCQGHSAATVVDPLPLPSAWATESVAVTSQPDTWCNDYGTPPLQALISLVQAQNYDIQIGVARLDEARGILAQRRGARMPSVSVQASGEAEWAGGARDDELSLTAPVAYEVDLWGRVRAAAEAQRWETVATQLDVEALRLSVSAEAAHAYFALVQASAEVTMLQEQRSSAETFMELTRLRQMQGMASALDLVQQRQQLDELDEAIVLAELRGTLAHGSLATLAGQTRQSLSITVSDILPDLPPLGQTPLPAVVLDRRPDVRAARARASAADARVTSVLAERLPRLQLSAELGVQAMNLSTLFDHLFGVLLASVSQNVWDGGQRRGRQAAAEAVKERTLLEYARVLLRAIAEVEDALARGQALEAAQAAQRRQLSAAREALAMAEVQYRAGVQDYLRVLTARQSLRRLELGDLEGRRAIVAQRIQLCRAIGGGRPMAEEGP